MSTFNLRKHIKKIRKVFQNPTWPLIASPVIHQVIQFVIFQIILDPHSSRAITDEESTEPESSEKEKHEGEEIERLKVMGTTDSESESDNQTQPHKTKRKLSPQERLRETKRTSFAKSPPVSVISLPPHIDRMIHVLITGSNTGTKWKQTYTVISL